MAQFSIQNAFSAGEISPSLFGQTSLAKFHVAASTLRNCYVNYRGGAYSRAGTALCAYAKQSVVGGIPPRVITFQYNINQGYCLELGDHYMRFFFQGAPILENGIQITNISNSATAIVAAVNTFAAGDWVVLNGVAGMTQVNGNTYVLGVTNNTLFNLVNYDGVAINSLGYGIYTAGGTASRVYTLSTPWAIADIASLKFTQSADVMTFTHPSYPQYDLERITANNWLLTPESYGAKIAAPPGITVEATVNPSQASSPPTLPAAYAYVVTAVDVNGDESIASPIGNVVNSVDISQTAGSEIINWDPSPGAETYNVYKAPVSYNTQPDNTSDALPVPVGSLFGYVATSYGTQFVDSNATADVTQSPPTHLDPFAPGQILEVLPVTVGSGYTSASLTVNTSTGSGLVALGVIVNGTVAAWIIQNAGSGYATTDTATVTGNGSGATASLTIGPQTGTYPSVVAYYQQRRVFGNSNNNPDTYWMSKPGLFSNFDAAIPTQDSDAITGTPWSQEVNGIQWMIPMPGGLVVLTGLGAWQVTGAGGSALNPVAITPESQQAQPQAFNGCSALVQPLRIKQEIIYVQAKGSIVLDLSYNYWTNIYTGNDLTQLSGQMFTGYTLSQAAWAEEPNKIAWYTRNDGVLLSLTFLKEQEVSGWARHDTFGQFWSVTVVTEPPVDALYMVTQRYPTDAPNQSRYYIERQDNRIWGTIEDTWCVDAGLRLPQPTPTAALAATAASGNIEFVASTPIFSTASVGNVIRMGGGIATITSFIDAMHVNATVNSPIVDTIPNSPGPAVVVQGAGSWTMTTPVTTISGLGHLVGLPVTGLADGVPIPPQVVSATGTITLSTPATAVTVGLGFAAQMQSVYLDTSTQPTIQGRRKTLTAVTVRTEASAGFQAGTNQPDGAAVFPQQIAPAWTGMAFVPPPAGTQYTSPGGSLVQNLYTGDTRINLLPDWQTPGQVAVQQTLPLPLNLTAIVIEGLEGDAPEVGYPQGGQQQQQAPRGPGAWMLR